MCLSFRGVTLLLVFLLVTSGSTYAARQKIIILHPFPLAAIDEYIAAYTAEMNRTGYTKRTGTDIVILRGDGTPQKLESLLQAEMQRQNPSLVLAMATMGAQVAQKVLKYSSVPIVFGIVADPVGAGLIAKENAPTGTNITGTIYSLFRNTKMQIVSQLLLPLHTSSVARIGVIHSSYQSERGDYQATVAAAAAYPFIRFVHYEIPYEPLPDRLKPMLANVKKGIAALEDKVDYWWFVPGPLAQTAEYPDLFLKSSKKPVLMGVRRQSVAKGVLMSVTPDEKRGGEELAQISHKILTGTPVGSIPVSTPDAFAFAVNVRVAVALGITIPPSLLTLAGEEVYR